MATLRPGESLEHLLTEDDHRRMQRALDGEARGDARLSRPLPVDRATAKDVAEGMRGEDDLGWFWALATACEEGGLSSGSTCGNGTLWSTDIVPERHRQPSEAGRVKELRAAGLTECQANGVCVVKLGLVVAETSGDVGPIASHVTAVLMDPGVHEALKEHNVGSGKAPWFRILAAGTPSPARERCLELAELSEERAA